MTARARGRAGENTCSSLPPSGRPCELFGVNNETFADSEFRFCIRDRNRPLKLGAALKKENEK